MPRELVRCDGPFHVKVGWANDRDVQVGVEGDEGRSLNWLLYGPQHEEDHAVLARLGEQVRAAVADTAHLPVDVLATNIAVGTAVLNALDSMPGAAYRGVWVTLDRHGCNRLIRLLRKARDSAFGADA